MLLKIASLLLFLHTAASYFTRLPCIKYADFFPQRNQEYEGEVITALQKEDEARCSIACVANEACHFATFFREAKICQLKREMSPDSVANNKVTTLRTVNDWKNIGPICEHSKPCPEVCRDVCTDYQKGHEYRCFASNRLQIQANKETNALSANWEHINDGDINTVYWNTSPPSGSLPFVYVSFDLKYSFYVFSIKLQLSGSAPDDAIIKWKKEKASEYSDPVAISTTSNPMIIKVSTTIRYIQIDNCFGLGINEVEVWG